MRSCPSSIEVLRGDPPCGAFVDPDRRHVEVLGAAVHEDETRASLEKLGVVRVPAADIGDLGGDEHHALDAALEEHADVVALAARRAVRVAEDRREPAARRVHLHRLGERREHGVRELGDEEPDRARRLGGSTRRDVEQVAHGTFDAVARLRAHRGRAARDPRSGCHANSGAVGDVSKTGHRLRLAARPWGAFHSFRREETLVMSTRLILASFVTRLASLTDSSRCG